MQTHYLTTHKFKAVTETILRADQIDSLEIPPNTSPLSGERGGEGEGGVAVCVSSRFDKSPTNYGIRDDVRVCKCLRKLFS